MPCNLVILGKHFDIDAFLEISKLRGYFKSYKGEPVFKSKPQGRKLTQSRVSIQTSKAEFDNLDMQIKDTIRYLKKHKDKLSYINKTKEIEYAFLDFGIDLRIDGRNTIMQSDMFPIALVKPAGEIGLSIMLSIYPIDMENILEKRKAKPSKKSA